MTLRLLVLFSAALLTGCGGEAGNARPALQATAANLEKIESGVLSLSVRMEPKDGEAFGYDIEGPIRLGERGKPPAADVEYTQLANGTEETVRLVLGSDGSGRVERDGERTELTGEQLEELRRSGALLGERGLASLSFERWVEEPMLSSGPDETDKVTGELDVAAAMAGLAALSGVLRENVVLTREQRDQVAAAVEESSFELLTGEDDRLLRRLALAFSLEAEVPESLREALGEDVVGARFSFELGLEQVNEPVQIGG